MQQSKTLFFAIIGLATLIVVGMVVAGFFFSGSLEEISPIQQNAIEIQVVVAPALEAWVDEAAKTFNQANRNTQVEVVTADELIPTRQFRADTSQARVPAGWLAEASYVVEMAGDSGLPFEDPQSVAQTSLAWGGYQDKISAFSQEYGPLSWESLHAKATSPQGVKLVIASPQNSAEGIAALVSAVAAHLDRERVSSSDVGAANQWLTETLGEGNTNIPSRPAESFASVQGRTLGDVGLLSLASWRRVKLDPSEDFSVTPVEPGVTLDYPFAIWTGNGSTPEAQAAARAFRDFLLADQQQSRLAEHFFEPASPGQSGIEADGSTAERIRNWAGRVLR